MNALTRVMKRPPPPKRKDEEEEDERKKLKDSLHETEKTALFHEYKVKDIQKDLRTRDELLREKQRQIDSMMPLFHENNNLRKRIEDLESKLFTQVRLVQSLDARVQTQADELGKVHQKRIADARSASMHIINEHVQLLQNLFLKYVTDPKSKDECLSAFVVSMDAIRTAVGINLM